MAKVTEYTIGAKTKALLKYTVVLYVLKSIGANMDFCDPTKEQKSLQYHIDKAKRSFQERLEYKPRLERNMERAKEFIKAVKVYISRGGQGSQALSQTLGDEEIRLIRFKADYERNKVKLKEIEEFLKENGVDVDALYY